MKTVKVGIIGSGFSADLHADALKKVTGTKVIIQAVAGRNRENALKFAMKHGIPDVYDDYASLLKDKDIDAVCVCVPNSLHAEVAIQAANAKKHVIIEKPLTGFFGSHESLQPGESYANTAMEEALKSANAVLETAAVNQVKIMYAENWIYTPSVIKTKKLLEAGDATILDIRAEESHSGSHAHASKRVETAGGGALLILGSHPIGAAIHLKNFEGKLKDGKPIGVQSVIADTAQLTKTRAFQGKMKHWMVTDWINVETWASVSLTFTDGTKAVIVASFAVLGGIKNEMIIYSDNSVIKCNMTPNNGLMVYAPETDVFAQEYIAEKLETKAGWNFATPDEDWFRGYPQEMQDFVECIVEGREPVSNGQLARDVVEVIYAAYLSAETGRRITLPVNF